MSQVVSQPAADKADPGALPVKPVSTRIAYLVNQYPQTSQSFIRREIAALEELGWNVERFTVRAGPADLVDPQDRAERQRTRAVLDCGAINLLLSTLAVLLIRPVQFLRTLRLTVQLARPSGRGLPIHLAYLAEACVLWRWFRSTQVAHVHAHFGTNSTTVAMLLHALGGPGYSFTCHGPEEFDMPVALSLGEKVRRCAFAAAISTFGRSQLCRWVEHEHWEKVKIVRCGLDGAFLDAPPAPIPDTPRLLNVGRLSAQKGQLLLIEAAAQLRREGVAFELEIIGQGELRGSIEQLIDRHQLRGCVRLLGWRSAAEVKSAMDACRALVLPSFAEGLPVVIMESLARHRPVISTAIAGIPDLVRSGQTGWLIPAGDVDALCEAMRQALGASVESLEAMGRAGARLVARHHRATSEAATLAGHFRKALADRPDTDR